MVLEEAQLIDLLAINIVYVAYRLIVSAHIVKFVNKYVPYYVAVLIMAQVSFAYDAGLFSIFWSVNELPALTEIIKSDIMYTLRVLAAWWLIKKIWDKIGNYWVAVFIGAEITFILDYFIFAELFY